MYFQKKFKKKYLLYSIFFVWILIYLYEISKTIMYKRKIQSGINPFTELKMVTNWIEEDKDGFYSQQNELSKYKIYILNKFIVKELIMCFILSLFINDRFRNKIIGFIERNKISEENMFFIRSIDLNCITMISFVAFIIDLIYLIRRYGIPHSFVDVAFSGKYLIIPFLYIISYFIFYKYGRLQMYLLISPLFLFLQPNLFFPIFLNINQLLKSYEKFNINLFDERIIKKLAEFNIKDDVYISKIPRKARNMGVVKLFTRMLVLIEGEKDEYENNPKLLNGMFSHELGHISRGYKDILMTCICGWLLDILMIILIDFFNCRNKKSSKLSRFTNFFIFCMAYFFILRDYISILILILKRNEEVYSDKYSLNLGFKEELAYSLFKISYEHTCFQESEIYNFIRFVHPSTITRIRRLIQ